MNARPPNETWFDRRGLWLLAALSLAPLGWCWSQFHQVFWFGDEWDQLDQIARTGFWRWCLGFFGENFAPLFKLAWGGTVVVTGGNYFAVVVFVWLVHLTAVALLGRWMREAGFGVAATALAMVLFSLPGTNWETFSWTVQLLTVQGMLFFLAAARWLFIRDLADDWNPRALAVFALLVAASTLSFVRGPLAGATLAVMAIVPWWWSSAPKPAGRSRLLLAAISLTPGLVVTVLLLKFAHGNHERLSQVGFAAPLKFATWYYLLNPLHRILDVSTFGPATTTAVGAAKLALLALGWQRASATQRRVLLPLLLFDLGNALLLGLGRYHTGLPNATSSRYQYISFLCAAPFFGLCLEAALAPLARFGRMQRALAAAAVLALAVGLLRGWPEWMRPWAHDRKATRDLVDGVRAPAAQETITGLEWIPDARARELMQQFHLH